MWTIAKLSIKEVMSKRIFHITLLMTIVYLAFYALAIHYGASELGRKMNSAFDEAFLVQSFYATQFLGIGLYIAAFITALLTILSSVGSIASEIESHQIDTWLARPLSRRAFLMGKFTGLTLLLVTYAAFLFTSLILMNQWFGGNLLKVDISFAQFVKAFSIFLIQPVMLVAVSLLLSSKMTTVNGGVVLIMLYGISFVGGFVEQLGAMMEKVGLQNIGIVSSLLFPVDSLFRKMMIMLVDQADNPFSFASQGIFASLSAPSDMMLIYSVLYGAAALFIAIRTMSSRDV